MARKPRIEFAGAVYHVLSRGDRGEPIYQDDEDRLLFLRFLGEVCERTGWLIHAYILMTNHYHILLETPGANLVVGMKWLQGTYTQRFNLRHRLRGHLFQGRYKALLIDGEEAGYFLQASSYIHLNPVRAGLIKAGQRLRTGGAAFHPIWPLPPKEWNGFMWIGSWERWAIEKTIEETDRLMKDTWKIKPKGSGGRGKANWKKNGRH